MQMQDHSSRGPDVVRFLPFLLREIPGTILVIWDGATIHRWKVLNAFVAQPGGTRMQLEHVPGSAPEVNPMEGVWNSRTHHYTLS